MLGETLSEWKRRAVSECIICLKYWRNMLGEAAAKGRLLFKPQSTRTIKAKSVRPSTTFQIRLCVQRLLAITNNNEGFTVNFSNSGNQVQSVFFLKA